ncbi:MAG: lamin tail domain-containing protein [Bacteroidetes bacterium]|nr:lamin tail domain-containing protein [Bacteroidota bacterium]
MKKMLLLVFLLPLAAFSQIEDDFEDGNISDWTESTYGRWEASTDNPINGTHSLHHVYDNPDDGIDLISKSLCPIELQAGITIWQFQVRHGYAPSSSNRWAVYLSSDINAESIAASGNANGYVVGVNFDDESDDMVRLWLVTNGSADAILNTNLDWEDNFSTSGICGFEVTRSSTGDWIVKMDTDGGFDNLSAYGNVYDNTYSAGKYFVLFYEYSSAQDKKLWFDDLTISSTGTSSFDLDSEVEAPDDQVAAGEISSLTTSSSVAAEIFKFKISDMGTSDGTGTLVNGLIFKNANPSNSANWESAIQGIVLNDGTGDVTISNLDIYSNYISVILLSGELEIADNSSKEITLSVYLNSSYITEGKNIQMYIDAEDHGFAADNNASGFACSFSADVTSEIFTITVEASRLNFTAYPTVVGLGVEFSATVSATDENGNIDNDGAVSVTLSRDHGAGILTSVYGLSQNLTAGSYTWYDLQYNTAEYFSIRVSDDAGTIPSLTGNDINCIEYPDSVFEKFDDGNFTVNPVWVGKTLNFIVDPLYKELQLYPLTDDPDTSYLATTVSTTTDSLEWQFYIRLGFSPSDDNNARFYLMADDNDLTGVVNGYFIQIGEGLSADALELFRQDGDIIVSLCRATDGQIAVTPEVRVKVKRNPAGLWRMYADYSGGNIFHLEDSATDITYAQNLFSSGVYCCHLAPSYNKKFFFDDIYIGPYVIDTVPPGISELNITGTNKLDVYFTEGVEMISAEVFDHYSLNNTEIPADVERDAVNYSLVHLTFDSDFIEEAVNTLFVSGVEDFEGNTVVLDSATFVLYTPKAFDILITEIMTDIDPVPIGLPEADYLELYNRSDYTISLEGWTIQPRASYDPIILPYMQMDPGEYLILTLISNANALRLYGAAIGLSGFYINSGEDGEEVIVLRDENGNLIHSIAFTKDYYHSAYKNQGGWSLEMIDPGNPCGGVDNWCASVDIDGGTPGELNSVYGYNPDGFYPDLIRATMLSDDSVRLHFSEPLHPASLKSPTVFSVDHGVGSPTGIVTDDGSMKTIVLAFSHPFHKDTVYMVTVLDSVTDCLGYNVVNYKTADFGILSRFKAPFKPGFCATKNKKI